MKKKLVYIFAVLLIELLAILVLATMLEAFQDCFEALDRRFADIATIVCQSIWGKLTGILSIAFPILALSFALGAMTVQKWSWSTRFVFILSLQFAFLVIRVLILSIGVERALPW